MKISDNVATDEAEPEVLFTAGQHAREHLTIEMALYLLNELTSKYATDARVRGLRRHARDLDRAEHEPGRQRVRRRLRQLPLVAQEPPAERRLDRRRHRPQPQLGLQLGLLRRLERHVLLRDLPRRVRVLGARDPARARLRQQPRRRRRPADQDQHRLPHLLRARALALRLHDRGHRARPDADDAGHVRDARPQHGGDQRLHARAGERPLHHRRLDRRLALGRAQDLRATRSRCTRAARAPASTRPTR